MINKTIANSFIYDFKWIISEENISKSSLDFRKILVKIWDKFYLFWADTSDFSDEEIKDVYLSEQIYLNTKLTKVSVDFLNDYKKLKNNWKYFEIEKTNLFKIWEIKVREILDEIFIWDCLDIGCGDSLYKDIFAKKWVNYLGIDIHKVDNWLNIQEISFEEFEVNNKFDTILFFRSINHFEDTNYIFSKALSYLKDKGKIFIIENELFWELKFKSQVFEWKQSDFEHFHNYSLKDFKSVVKIDNFNILYEDSVSKKTANQWYICLEKK
jgi:SAM-dependent methyltransferase